jgi:hypothetical protein
VAQVLRLSDVAAVEVAVAVSHVLLPFGQFFQAADEIPAREILLGVTEIFPRHAEVLGGFTEVTTVVAAMVMMAVVTMMAMMVVVIVIEDVIQETSDETSRKTWQQTEHELFSIVARGACACLMPTLKVPADGLIKTEANPSFCDLQHARRRGHKMLFFSTKQRATEGAIAFDDLD